MYMTNANAYDQYRKAAVLTASKEKLLLMLYDGLVLYLNQAKRGIEHKNLPEVSRCLLKGQNIIAELMSTLNLDYEICTNLHQLYDYMKRRLVTANVNKDAGIVDEVLGMVTELRGAWAEAADQLSGGQAPGRRHG